MSDAEILERLRPEDREALEAMPASDREDVMVGLRIDHRELEEVEAFKKDGVLCVLRRTGPGMFEVLASHQQYPQLMNWQELHNAEMYWDGKIALAQAVALSFRVNSQAPTLPAWSNL